MSRYRLCNIYSWALIHMHGPITTSPLGKHAAPQSPADNADVLPTKAASFEAHLEEKSKKMC